MRGHVPVAANYPGTSEAFDRTDKIFEESEVFDAGANRVLRIDGKKVQAAAHHRADPCVASTVLSVSANQRARVLPDAVATPSRDGAAPRHPSICCAFRVRAGKTPSEPLAVAAAPHTESVSANLVPWIKAKSARDLARASFAADTQALALYVSIAHAPCDFHHGLIPTSVVAGIHEWHPGLFATFLRETRLHLLPSGALRLLALLPLCVAVVPTSVQLS